MVLKFKEFLEVSGLSESKPADVGNFIYGDGAALSKLKWFFTGNWVEPMNASKKQGFRALKKAGFSEEEAREIRNAIHTAMSEAITKFGDPSQASKDDSNFSGWILSVSHPASGGTFASKNVKSYIKNRVNEILSKKA